MTITTGNRVEAVFEVKGTDFTQIRYVSIVTVCVDSLNWLGRYFKLCCVRTPDDENVLNTLDEFESKSLCEDL